VELPLKPSASPLQGRWRSIQPFHATPAIHSAPTWNPFNSSARAHQPRTSGHLRPPRRLSTTIIPSAAINTSNGIRITFRVSAIFMEVDLLDERQSRQEPAKLHASFSKSSSKFTAKISSACELRLLSPLE